LEAKLRPFVARRVRNSADVDDLLQEVFLRMQRGLPTLQDEQRFGPWVYQVARNVIVDHQRATMRHPSASRDDQADGRAAERAESGEAIENAEPIEHELANYVALFVAALPSPYREALTLTELQGLTQKEAAEMLGISLSGMKSRVQRGREQLRSALSDCCSIALDVRGGVLECQPRTDGKLPEGCCK
jgi:RNA polymerase sigma-70 factor, ECF subfamily